MTYHNPPTTPRRSAVFDDYTLSEIRRAAQTGIYDIRGGGAKRVAAAPKEDKPAAMALLERGSTLTL